MMRTTEVAILGGGLAGLNAARLLHRAGCAFRLLEARERLGGRILTVDASGAPAADGFDLGPSWFWPLSQPDLAGLVQDLGLSAIAQAIEGDLLFERSRAEPPLRTNGASFDQGSMRLVGGTAALVRALALTLPAQNLWLNKQVRALELGQGDVIVTLSGPGQGLEQLRARHVISTLPPRLLAERLELRPAADMETVERWRATPTWMAPHAKVFALFDRPFWREAGLSGMAQSLVGPMGEVHDATTASGEAALFGFVGIPATQRASLGRDRLIRAALDQLVRLFGPQAARPRATLLKDWADDALTATGADARATGHPVAARAPWVTGPWAERLTFAGSEASTTEPGYLAGAVEASRRAVDGWLRRRSDCDRIGH